ncbi:hypothetical protein FACS189430_01000 [Bacteroidia bacterium]|nr:hypothetical protein FACS189430_01000 [Bacteroidia bacterium]
MKIINFKTMNIKISIILITAALLLGFRDDGVNDKIKDARFLEYCLDKFDRNGDGILTLDEALAVKIISIPYSRITSFEGIELFANLEDLYCESSYKLKKNLDVSRNTKLKRLNCSATNLKTLDVSKNTELIDLKCSLNQLTSLDISQNTELTVLRCEDNQLTSLDASKNTKLTELHCGYNQFTKKALNEMFKNLPSVTKGIIGIMKNPDAQKCRKKIAEKKGWEVHVWEILMIVPDDVIIN